MSTQEFTLPLKLRTEPIDWKREFEKASDFDFGRGSDRQNVQKQIMYEDGLIHEYMTKRQVDFGNAVDALVQQGDIFGLKRIEKTAFPVQPQTADMNCRMRYCAYLLGKSMADAIDESKIKPVEIGIVAQGGDFATFEDCSPHQTLPLIVAYCSLLTQDVRYAVKTLGGGFRERAGYRDLPKGYFTQLRYYVGLKEVPENPRADIDVREIAVLSRGLPKRLSELKTTIFLGEPKTQRKHHQDKIKRDAQRMLEIIANYEQRTGINLRDLGITEIPLGIVKHLESIGI